MVDEPRNRQEQDSKLDAQWAVLLHFLPRAWQDAAWTCNAIARLRVIQSAEALLRIIFAYVWYDWSLRTTATWAHRTGLADLSDVAGLKRLRHAPAWLGHLLDQWFRSQGIGTTVTSRFQLVLTDGSTIQRRSLVELPGAHGGESLTRLRLRPHDVVLGDRNNIKADALAWVRAQHAEVIVRFGWNALRLQNLDGTSWSVLDAVRTPVVGTPGEWIANPRKKERPTLPVRIVAMWESAAAAEKARRTARKDTRAHGHTVSQATLSAGEADAGEILELHRLRWPIALASKRLKSLIHIDEPLAFDQDLAQTYWLAKLLGAVLVDALRTHGPDYSPTDFPSARTSSGWWRISQRIWQDFRTIVQGLIHLNDWGPAARSWTKALYERPRQRRLALDSAALG